MHLSGKKEKKIRLLFCVVAEKMKENQETNQFYALRKMNFWSRKGNLFITT